MRVDVWKTAFNYSDYLEGDIYQATYTGDDADYAIHQVFGGGNQADYKPQNGSTDSEKRTAAGRILMETLKTSHRRWHLSWGMQAEYTSAVT